MGKVGRFQRLIAALCGVTAIAGTVAGSADDSVPPAPRIQVVASIFPVADWVRQVGGDRVQVVTLLPAGSSPHTFDPSPREVRSVGDARLFVKVGLRLDDWTARIAEAAGSRLTIVSLGDNLAAGGRLPAVENLLESEVQKSAQDNHAHDHDGVNPHFWLDPTLARMAADDIARELARIDPPSSATYARNAARYAAELEVLDTEISSSLSQCRNRSFVSFHNAFCYLARRYGLHVAAVIEEYPGKTPSDRYVKGVIDQLRRLGIKTVFAEPQLSPRVAEIIALEAGATVDLLDPNGGEKVADRDSYVKLMRYNAAKLRTALCGTGK
jgi:zinc transport system substrate-binding protein